jgi:hypothetical protein
MKSLFAVTLASVYGLSVRLLFGFFQNFMGIMSMTFLIFIPVVIGFLTVFLMYDKKNTNAISAFCMPWVTSLLILFITIVTNVEGTICWILIYPMFAILAGFGGLMAYGIKKRNSDKPDKPENLYVSLLLFVPLFIGYAEGDRGLSPKEFNITNEVVIKASTTEVWQALLNINEIKKAESSVSLSSALGFPKHLKTTLDTAAVGGKRMAIYDKGLYFEETISKYEKEKWMVLDIKTDPHKIPPTVMDEHILIGGKHVDILEDSYKLEQLPDGSSKLSLSSRFYINTPFNWYAGIWANYLMSDILQGELDIVKERVENKK